jgi:hypothetical protein
MVPELGEDLGTAIQPGMAHREQCGALRLRDLIPLQHGSRQVPLHRLFERLDQDALRAPRTAGENDRDWRADPTNIHPPRERGGCFGDVEGRVLQQLVRRRVTRGRRVDD